MRNFLVFCVFLGTFSCAHRPSRQRVWWDEYGRFHNCRVVLAREVEVVNRRGYVREREQTCYVCPDSSTEYCFAGSPIGPPAGEVPPPHPPGMPPPPPSGPPPLPPPAPPGGN